MVLPIICEKYCKGPDQILSGKRAFAKSYITTRRCSDKIEPIRFTGKFVCILCAMQKHFGQHTGFHIFTIMLLDRLDLERGQLGCPGNTPHFQYKSVIRTIFRRENDTASSIFYDECIFDVSLYGHNTVDIKHFRYASSNGRCGRSCIRGLNRFNHCKRGGPLLAVTVLYSRSRLA